MSVKLSVRSMPRVIHDLQKAVDKVTGAGKVTVGIHQAHALDGRKGGEPNNPTIGAINHFGTETIPARPWLDKGVKAGAARITAHAVYCMKQGMEPARMLEQLGAMAVGEVQKYVTELDTPPNAPSTIRQKGSSNPLINTGALRQSITYEVH